MNSKAELTITILSWTFKSGKIRAYFPLTAFGSNDQPSTFSLVCLGIVRDISTVVITSCNRSRALCEEHDLNVLSSGNVAMSVKLAFNGIELGRQLNGAWEVMPYLVLSSSGRRNGDN